MRKVSECEFPGCEYISDHRNQIHVHHIIPRELGGSNEKINLISVCPNCHVKIYNPSSKHGIHSIKTANSIIINKWMMSTDGKVLEYIDIDGNVQYSFKNK